MRIWREFDVNTIRLFGGSDGYLMNGQAPLIQKLLSKWLFHFSSSRPPCAASSMIDGLGRRINSLPRSFSEQVGKAHNLQQRTYLCWKNAINETSVNQKEESVRVLRIILGGIVVLASPLSVPTLAQILDISEQDIEVKLDVLHSVLSVPETVDVPVRLLHQSFRDFLVDPSQRADNLLWIDEKEAHQEMAARCLRVLQRLRRDVCDIKAPGTPRSAIDQHRIETSIPTEVRYACLYWVDHLRNGCAPALHCDQVISFLERHFLHWIETLSLIGRSRESVHLIGALQLLYKVRPWCTWSRSDAVSLFLVRMDGLNDYPNSSMTPCVSSKQIVQPSTTRHSRCIHPSLCFRQRGIEYAPLSQTSSHDGYLCNRT